MSHSIEKPPSQRTPLGYAMAAASRPGNLILQHCDSCATVQYPPREVCTNCLGENLSWRETDSLGVLLSVTDLHNSLEPYYQQSTPWPLASVKLCCGPVVLTHNNAAILPGEEVDVIAELDSGGNTLLVARARGASRNS